jgi:septum formation protein
MGIVFEVSGSLITEQVLPGENPRDFTRRMAEEKARVVGRNFDDAWILGADTVVVIDGRIMGIPSGEVEALDMLETLSGRTHSVLTSFCIYRPSTRECMVRTVESKVVIKELSADEIKGYIHSREPFDKAGGYAVQGLGAFMVREINGSYTNVVGLPLCEVIEAMKELKMIQKFP